MDNEQTIKEAEKSQPEPSNEVAEVDIVEEAKKAANEIRASLEERKKILEREEKLIARQEALRQLGGGSIAGKSQDKPAEMTPREYREAIERGIIPQKIIKRI